MSLGIGGLGAGVSCDPSFLSALGLWSARPQPVNVLCISLYIYVFSESIRFVCEEGSKLGFAVTLK